MFFVLIFVLSLRYVKRKKLELWKIQQKKLQTNLVMQ
jgi:hypothetical protein